MPVILELEDYEASQVVDALVEQRIRLMKNWENRYRSPDENDGRYGIDIGKIGDLAMIDANIGTVYALRERLKDGIMVQRMCQEHALYPEKSVSVAWHHKRGWLRTADFVKKPIEDDQMSPGTWTTLPDAFGIDDWCHHVMAPDDQIVIASADRQNKVNLFPCEGGYVGLWRGTALGLAALITGNLSIANNEQLKAAQDCIRSSPELKAALTQRIDTLFV